MKTSRFIHTVLLFGMVLSLLTFSAVWGSGGNEEIKNKIVVVVDCSGSFKSQHQNAVQQTLRLLDSLAQTKMKRWEGESDEVNLISLDALPQIVWKGSVKALKTANLQDIVKLFSARKEFSSCTDVLGAFQLAFQNLEGDPRYVSKYLFVFSDLVHEPPTKNVTTCESPVKVQGTDFPWNLMEDVSTTIFWIPANQQLVWEKAVANYGLKGRVTMYSTGFSDNITIVPPPRPQEKVSAKEQEGKTQELVGTLQGIGKWTGAIFLGLLGVLGLVGLVAMMFRKRSSRPSAPRAGNIAPLPAARLVAQRSGR
jgi:hypothetical protein